MGFNAPPATNVIVAPGSARYARLFSSGRNNIQQSADIVLGSLIALISRTQPSVRGEHSTFKWIDKTLYSSDNLVNFESI